MKILNWILFGFVLGFVFLFIRMLSNNPLFAGLAFFLFMVVICLFIAFNLLNAEKQFRMEKK